MKPIPGRACEMLAVRNPNALPGKVTWDFPQLPVSLASAGVAALL